MSFSRGVFCHAEAGSLARGRTYNDPSIRPLEVDLATQEHLTDYSRVRAYGRAAVGAQD
jgi:hypothetical protein